MYGNALVSAVLRLLAAPRSSAAAHSSIAPLSSLAPRSSVAPHLSVIPAKAGIRRLWYERHGILAFAGMTIVVRWGYRRWLSRTALTTLAMVLTSAFGSATAQTPEGEV